MPSPKQNSLLKALEKGERVRAIARELGISMDLVNEWRDNPEFELLYLEACRKGKPVYTGGDEAEGDACEPHKPAVLRGHQGEHATVPLPLNPPKPMPLPKLSEPMVLPPPAPKRAPRISKEDEERMQQAVLAELRLGTRPTRMEGKVVGASVVRVGNWRRNDAFRVLYDEAIDLGNKVRALAAASKAEAEPAPNQSEPAPDVPQITDEMREQWKKDWENLRHDVTQALHDRRITDADAVAINDVTWSYPDAVAALGKALQANALVQLGLASVAPAPEANTVEREIRIPTHTDANGETQFGPDPERRYQVIRAITDPSEKWFTKEEAIATAKQLAEKNKEANWVVERVCTVELVPQVTY